MSRCNLHTHTVFCDGCDTPEELVLYAIANGCSAIGFSGHSYTDIPDDDPFCMTREHTEAYKREVKRLQTVYGEQIRIYLGVEQDYYSDETTDDYEYVIGSVHYIRKDSHYISVDESRETQIAAAYQYYGGDFYAFAEDYYALVGDLYRKTKCDIVGHFDLITKFNEENDLFDVSHPRYRRAVDTALEKLLNENLTFEINYGAVARGYRKEPYPEARILQKISAVGKPLVFTSDCHKKELLLFGIPDEKNTI